MRYVLRFAFLVPLGLVAALYLEAVVLKPAFEKPRNVIVVSHKGGEWNSPEAWVGGKVPGPEDEVTEDMESGTVILPSVINGTNVYVSDCFTGVFVVRDSVSGTGQFFIGNFNPHPNYPQ